MGLEGIAAFAGSLLRLFALEEKKADAADFQ